MFGRFDVTVEACKVGMTSDGRTGVTGRIVAAWAPKGRSYVLPCLGYAKTMCDGLGGVLAGTARVFNRVSCRCRLMNSYC